MVKKIGISISDYVYGLIEERRGERSRSEFCEELMLRGMGVVQ